MGTKSSKEKLDYYIDKLINEVTDRIPFMNDKQLERIETYAKAEIWDRYNQPNNNNPVSKL
jgi:hypothetical protein